MGARGVTSVAVAALLLVPGAAPSASAAAPRVIVSPTPGVVVKGNTLRIVVRGAGDEYGDLTAKLNGREVGREFARGRGGPRVLRVSVSHGLRHGRNVLTVRARRGVRTRRATVRFTVRRTAHLVGAGRDRLLTVGTPVEIAGHVLAAPGGRRPGATRLTVTRTPPGSRLARSATPTPAARTSQAALTPLQPALTPDLPGRYTVRVTVGSGRAAVSDEVTMDARPKDPLVAVDTLAAEVDGRPAMRLGSTTYPAPYLSAVDGKGQYAQGTPGTGVSWRAEWHVMAVSRTDTRVLWQRTYGFCSFEGQPARECRAPDSGPAERPVIVDSRAEVAALAPATTHDGAIIIARTLPTASTGADEVAFLPAIGYERRPRGADVSHSFLHSVIGVPGMQKGEADMSGVVSRGWLRGFLTVNQDYKFHFLRGQRPLFDTRGSGTSCTAAPAQCTVTQTVDGQTVSGTVPNGRGGYLVSAWNPETLAPRHSEFVMIDSNSSASQDGTRGLLALLQRWRDDGSVILISTLHTPGMDPGTLIGGPPDAWNALTDLIASIGGTTNGFLRAVSTRGAEYTLVGWGGAGEGNGKEAGGDGDPARLRGALLTDNHGNFVEPANVSSIGPPAERLNTLMITPTSTAWKYPPGTPEGDAIACIGAAGKKGIDIRATYRDLRASDQAIEVQSLVANTVIGDLKPVAGTALTCTPTQEQFEAARKQLVDELGHVASVRTYLAELSRPEVEKGELVWGQAVTLGNELKDVLDQEEQQREVIVDSLGLVATLLDLIAPGISTFVTAKKVEKITHVVEASAAAFELASRSIERDAAGRESEDTRVQAAELATKLQIKAQSTSAAFGPLGDVIVGDPDKLAEVGGNYHCPIGPGGCPEGMEEYSATNTEIKDLSDVSLRGMGREIYSTLVPRMYQTWDTGLTAFPDDPYGHFFCFGASSPFGAVPADQYAASLERVNHGRPSLYRIYLSIRSATYWEAIPKDIAERMFGEPGASWNAGGLGMDRLTYLREMEERFTPGSYRCWFNG